MANSTAAFMSLLCLALLLVTAVTYVKNVDASITSDSDATDSALLKLGDANFTEHALHPKKCTLVKFFAPWCGHCKSMAADYIKLSNSFVNEENVQITEVDCTVETATAGDHGIQGYPTLKLFPANTDKKKTAVPYNGKRSLKEMIDFVNKECGTFRNIDGKLTPSKTTAGILNDLNEPLKQLFASELTTSTIESFTKNDIMVENEHLLSYNRYTKMLKLILSRGLDFIPQEIERSMKMLESPNSHKPTSIDEAQLRINVLKHLSEFVVGSDNKGGEL
jgi:protein disulfide-isomerase A6